MTDTPYTRADLIAEAARQHHELTQEQNFVDTGERMEGAPIASAEGATWDALDDRHYDTAMREIESLIEGSADTSPSDSATTASSPASGRSPSAPSATPASASTSRSPRTTRPSTRPTSSPSSARSSRPTSPDATPPLTKRSGEGRHPNRTEPRRRTDVNGTQPTCDDPSCEQTVAHDYVHRCGRRRGGIEFGCGKYFCGNHRYYDYPSNQIGVCSRCRDEDKQLGSKRPIKHRVRKSVACTGCGDRIRVQKTFIQYRDDAAVDEIVADLEESAAAWRAAPEICRACVADTTAWGRGLRSDGLVPDGRSITLGRSDWPKARIHLAFAEDITETDRDQLVARIRAAIDDHHC
ncbi:hypothetical protein ACFC1B_07255 [Streptomyces xiamenensis]|uniref:hypothetical protein n=1 Tax=Streptomyces xiamenensis TaxID=408015 RepID=UPI0035DBDE98